MMLSPQVIHGVFYGITTFGIPSGNVVLTVARYNEILSRLSMEYGSFIEPDWKSLKYINSSTGSMKSGIQRISTEDTEKIHEYAIKVSFNNFYAYLIQRLDDSYFSHPIVSIIGDLLSYRDELKSLGSADMVAHQDLIGAIKVFVNYTYGMFNNANSILRINESIVGHYSMGDLIRGEGISYWNRLHKALFRDGYRIVYVDTDECYIAGSRDVSGLVSILDRGDYPKYEIMTYDYMIIPRTKAVICMLLSGGKLTKVVYNSKEIS